LPKSRIIYQKLASCWAKPAMIQSMQHFALHKARRKVLNRLLDGSENGFEQGISGLQYQKVAKVSKTTATRHLTDWKKAVLKSWKQLFRMRFD
jgi:Fic family protein